MIDEQRSQWRWIAAKELLAADSASRSRGIEITSVTEDTVEISVRITPDDANGVGIVHGGLTYFLADSAVGFASNLEGRPNVVSSATVTYLAPGRLGEQLRAVCTGPIARSGRKSEYSTTVTRPDGQLIAVIQSTTMELRQSTLKGKN